MKKDKLSLCISVILLALWTSSTGTQTASETEGKRVQNLKEKDVLSSDIAYDSDVDYTACNGRLLTVNISKEHGRVQNITALNYNGEKMEWPLWLKYDPEKEVLQGIPPEGATNQYIIQTTYQPTTDNSSRFKQPRYSSDYFTINVPNKGLQCQNHIHNPLSLSCHHPSPLTVFKLHVITSGHLSDVDKVFLLEGTAHLLDIETGLLYFSSQDLPLFNQNVNVLLSGPNTNIDDGDGVSYYMSLLVGCGDVHADWLKVLEKAEYLVKSNKMFNYLNNSSRDTEFYLIQWTVSIVEQTIKAQRVKRSAGLYPDIQSTSMPYPVVPDAQQQHHSNVINTYPSNQEQNVDPVWAYDVGKSAYNSKKGKHEEQLQSDQPVLKRRKGKRSRNRALDFKNRHDRRWRRRQRKRKERRRRRKEKKVIEELMQLLPSLEEYDQINPTPPTTHHKTKTQRENIIDTRLSDLPNTQEDILRATPIARDYSSFNLEATPSLGDIVQTVSPVIDSPTEITQSDIILNVLTTIPHSTPTLNHHMTTYEADVSHNSLDHQQQNDAAYINEHNTITSNLNAHNIHNKKKIKHHQKKHPHHYPTQDHHQEPVKDNSEPEEEEVETRRNYVESDTFNYGPIVLNGINRLETEVGDILDYQIPRNTFYDHEDGDASDLSLHLLTDDGAEMSSSSWINFNKHTRGIYAMPLPENVGRHSFVLSATDSGGKSVYEGFEIIVRHRANQWRINHEFSLSLDLEYQKFLRDLNQRMDVTRRLASVYGDTNANNIHVTSVEHGSVVLSWTNKTMQDSDCPITKISNLVDHFMDVNNNASQKLIAQMHPYKVLRVSASCKGSCRVDAAKSPQNEDKRIESRTPLKKEGAENSHRKSYPSKLTSFVVMTIVFVICFAVAIIVKYINDKRNQKLANDTRNDTTWYHKNLFNTKQSGTYTILENQQLKVVQR